MRSPKLPGDTPEIGPGHSPDSPPKAPQNKGAGAYGGYGLRLRLRTLSSVDRRTSASRDLERLTQQMMDDLGGEAQLTTAKRELIRRAAFLAAVLEDAEASWVAGTPTDLGEYALLANTMRRLAVTAGVIERGDPRNVTPSVDAYLARREEAA